MKDRIKYAMDHLSHKEHTSLLARPNWRRTQTRNVNILQKPYSVRRPALKARASKRIKVMAKPKHVNKKYDPAKAPPISPRIHPKTLEAKSSKRIVDLALPKKRVLVANLKFPTSTNVADTLRKVQHSRYRKYRYFCNARQQREAKKNQKIMAKLRRVIKPEEWDQHMEVIEALATPKEPPRPWFPIGKRKKWRPVNMRRIEELSTPVAKEVQETIDPFTVPKSALVFKTTKRLETLAQPKPMPETLPPRTPGEVTEAALNAVASPWLINLAKPVVRPAGMQTDLREDAFTVLPRALKAKCSKRLKLLARPKKRS
ncbi:hypothetical protein ANTPLA_LOCUS10389 [Anthophora plagiata]